MAEELQKVSLRKKLDSFDETWAPKIVARMNDFAVKLVKLNGDDGVWNAAEHRLKLQRGGSSDTA